MKSINDAIDISKMNTNWIVALKTNPEEEFIGSGFLLSKEWVITAKHEIQDKFVGNINPSDLLGLLGKDERIPISFSKVVPHKSDEFDIAFLKINEGVLSERIVKELTPPDFIEFTPDYIDEVKWQHVLAIGYRTTGIVEDGCERIKFKSSEYEINGVLKDENIIDDFSLVNGQAVKGMSGGPVLVEVKNQFYLLGMLIEAGKKSTKGVIHSSIDIRSAITNYRKEVDDYLLKKFISIREITPKQNVVDDKNIKRLKPEGCNPFKGISYFEEKDEKYFFGRSVKSNEIVENININKHLTILGSSGSGKSSIIRAGCIPKLKSENIECIVLKPSDNNFLKTFHKTSADAVVFIDQFEELFGLAFDDKINAGEFLGYLSSEKYQFKLVISFREDFIKHIENNFPKFCQFIAQNQYYLPPLQIDELREAIEKPAQTCNYPIDVSTVELLVYEYERRRPLPLIQYALHCMWENKTEDNSWGEALKSIGNVGGALVDDAEKIYNELDEKEQSICKKLFILMVDVKTKEQLKVRKKVCIKDVASSDKNEQKTMFSIVQKYQTIRLIHDSEEMKKGDISFDDIDEVYYEFSHEAILEHWDRLKEWISEYEDEDLPFYKELENAANEHIKHPDFVWGGSKMQELEEFQNRWIGGDFPAFIKAFYEDSIKRGKEELLRLEKERENEKKLLENEKTAKKMLMFFSLGVSIIAIVAMLYWLKANKQTEIAKREKLEANYNLAKMYEEKAMRSFVDAQVEENIDLYEDAIIYGCNALLQKIDKDSVHLDASTAGKIFNANNLNKIFKRKWISPCIRSYKGGIDYACFSNDRKRIALTNSCELWVIDVESGNQVFYKNMFKEGNKYDESKTIFLSNKNTIAILLKKVVEIWNIDENQLIMRLTPPTLLKAYENIGIEISYDNETYLATDKYVWNLKNGKMIECVDDNRLDVKHIKFIDKNKLLKFARIKSDNTKRSLKKHLIIIQEVAENKIDLVDSVMSGSEFKTIYANERYFVYFNTGGTRYDDTSYKDIIMIDIIKKERINKKKLFNCIDTKGNKICITKNGQYCAVAERDDTLYIWDVDKDILVDKVKLHSGMRNDGSWYSKINHVEFSKDGKLIFTCSNDGLINIWDIENKMRLTSRIGHSGQVSGVSLSDDGKTIYSSSKNGEICVWDKLSGEQKNKYTSSYPTKYRINNELENDSQLFVVDRKNVKVFNKKNNNLILFDSLDYGWFFRLSNDKKLAFLKGGIVDQKSKQVKYKLKIPYVNDIRFNNNNNKILLITQYGKLYVVDWQNNIICDSLITKPANYNMTDFKAIYINDDNVIFASADHFIGFWKIGSNSFDTLYSHNNRINDICLSPDKVCLASASDDSTIKIWDIKEKKIIGVLKGHKGSVNCIKFNKLGNELISGSDDKTLCVWDLNEYLDEEIIWGINGKNNGKRCNGITKKNEKWITIKKRPFEMNISIHDKNAYDEYGAMKSHIKDIYLSNKKDDMFIWCGKDDTVNVYNIVKKQVVKKYHEPKVEGDSPMKNVRFHPNGEMIILGRNDSVIIRDISSGKNISSFACRNTSWDNWIDVNENTIAAISEKKIYLYDIRKKIIDTLNYQRMNFGDYIAVNEKMKVVAVKGSRFLSIWWYGLNKKSKKNKQYYLKGDGEETGIDINTNGKIMVLGYLNNIDIYKFNENKRVYQVKKQDGANYYMNNPCLLNNGTNLAYEKKPLILKKGMKKKEYDEICIHDFSLFYDIYISDDNNRYKKIFYEGVLFLFNKSIEKNTIVKNDVHTSEFMLSPDKNEKGLKYVALLSPPRPNQSKFQQLIEWAEEQLQKEEN